MELSSLLQTLLPEIRSETASTLKPERPHLTGVSLKIYDAVLFALDEDVYWDIGTGKTNYGATMQLK